MAMPCKAPGRGPSVSALTRKLNGGLVWRIGCSCGNGRGRRLVDLIVAPNRVIVVGVLFDVIAAGAVAMAWQIQDWRCSKQRPNNPARGFDQCTKRPGSSARSPCLW